MSQVWGNASSSRLGRRLLEYKASLTGGDVAKLAFFFKKSRRTIERWCARGVVPRAYQRYEKAQGRWRVRGGVKADDIPVIMQRIEGWERKRSAGTRPSCQGFSKVDTMPNQHIIHLALEDISEFERTGRMGTQSDRFAQLRLAAIDLVPSDLASLGVDDPRNEEAINIILGPFAGRLNDNSRAKKLVEAQINAELESHLMVTAVQIIGAGQRVTGQRLADALKISRMTLYRNYGAKAVARASALDRRDKPHHNTAKKNHRPVADDW